MLIRGNLLARITGRNFFTGFAFGWMVPLLSVLLALNLMPESGLRSPDLLAELLTGRFPLLAPPNDGTIITFYVLFIIYAFLVPLATAYLRRPLLLRLGAVLIGAG